MVLIVHTPKDETSLIARAPSAGEAYTVSAS
jgi:hypothetical protein